MFDIPINSSLPRKTLLLLCVACPSPVLGQSTHPDLSVLRGWTTHSRADQSLYRHLYAQALSLHRQRGERMESIQTREDWIRVREGTRTTLQKMWGPFPAKTDLNPRITGTLQRNGYRVEKLIYESQPGFYVTAALFIPDRLEAPAPAVVYCSGHSPQAFRSPVYQRVILNLVRKGFVVLAFDPISQGERLQYYDPQLGDSRIGGPTREHNYAGGQSYLLGLPLARTMIWDGVRAVDYLLTRQEVDSGRIGITGRSGGGTQSSFIAALDGRILAAAPENYLTTTHRLLQSIGPQDAEQIFPGGVTREFDFADLLTARAPRPTLAIATSRDYFSVQGFREMYDEVRRAYTALGAADQVRMSLDDAPHQSTRNNREALYGFFQQALSHPGSPLEEEVELLPLNELLVTSTGQVADSLGGRTVFDLLKDRTQDALQSLKEARARQADGEGTHFQRRARTLSGYLPPRTAAPVLTGRYQLDGSRLEKYFLEGAHYPLPFLLWLPTTGPGPHPAVVYLDDRGKEVEAGPGGVISELVRRGFAVLAPDLPGFGELGPADRRVGDGGVRVSGSDYTLWHLATMLERSLVGIRASDIVLLQGFLQDRTDIGSRPIAFLARGDTTAALLHAAAFQKTIRRIALIRPLASYETLVRSRYYDPTLIGETVARALPEYDLPDLMAGLAPRPLLVIDPVDARRRPVPVTAMLETYRSVRDRFQDEGAADSLRLIRLGPQESVRDRLLQWLQKE